MRMRMRTRRKGKVLRRWEEEGVVERERVFCIVGLFHGARVLVVVVFRWCLCVRVFVWVFLQSAETLEKRDLDFAWSLPTTVPQLLLLLPPSLAGCASHEAEPTLFP